MLTSALIPLTERQRAILMLLSRPDPPDLPRRQHHPVAEGNPEWQTWWRQYLPLCYVVHQHPHE